MRNVSLARARENRTRRQNVQETFGDRPVCERCGAYADDAHEVLSRARGGSITDTAGIIPLCRRCHEWITRNPLTAQAQGWSATSAQARHAFVGEDFYCETCNLQQLNWRHR